MSWGTSVFCSPTLHLRLEGARRHGELKLRPLPGLRLTGDLLCAYSPRVLQKKQRRISKRQMFRASPVQPYNNKSFFSSATGRFHPDFLLKFALQRTNNTCHCCYISYIFKNQRCARVRLSNFIRNINICSGDCKSYKVHFMLEWI